MTSVTIRMPKPLSKSELAKGHTFIPYFVREKGNPTLIWLVLEKPRSNGEAKATFVSGTHSAYKPFQYTGNITLRYYEKVNHTRFLVVYDE